MQWIELVVVLALCQYLFFAIMVGRARVKYQIAAPAVNGNENFERVYRVQMNTLELLVLLLPSVMLAGKYWSAPLIASIAAVYLVGRMLYWRAYVKDPAGRSIGFMLSIVPIFALMILTVVGIFKAM